MLERAPLVLGVAAREDEIRVLRQAVAQLETRRIAAPAVELAVLLLVVFIVLPVVRAGDGGVQTLPAALDRAVHAERLAVAPHAASVGLRHVVVLAQLAVLLAEQEGPALLALLRGVLLDVEAFAVAVLVEPGVLAVPLVRVEDLGVDEQTGLNSIYSLPDVSKSIYAL